MRVQLSRTSKNPMIDLLTASGWGSGFLKSGESWYGEYLTWLDTCCSRDCWEVAADSQRDNRTASVVEPQQNI